MDKPPQEPSGDEDWLQSTAGGSIAEAINYPQPNRTHSLPGFHKCDELLELLKPRSSADRCIDKSVVLYGFKLFHGEVCGSGIQTDELCILNKTVPVICSGQLRPQELHHGLEGIHTTRGTGEILVPGHGFDASGSADV